MIRILPLQPHEAELVTAMLRTDPEDYRRHFRGLPEDPSVLSMQIQSASRDCYWGIWWDNRLTSMFMLRGLDEGYTTPAFGVYVREGDAGHGLARLALQAALVHCRMEGIKSIMLTVGRENEIARGLYERMGFQPTGEISRKGDEVFRREA